MTPQRGERESAAEPLLAVRDLCVDFEVGNEWVPATRNVSFDVRAGEVLALVGESGSGKSVTSMSVLGLLAANARRTGEIRYRGRNLLACGPEEIRAIRGREIAMIFQEPMSALNPVYTIGEQIVEALRAHEHMPKAVAEKRALELLVDVGIPDPGRRIGHYPHQFSGGQLQRAMIAMAISRSPSILIADEPTTALDVTVQAEILQLLRGLKEANGMTILIITHDMGVVADLADRVVVMKDGAVVESAPVEPLFDEPQQPYTRQLLDSVPYLGNHAGSESEAEGTDDGAGTGDSTESSALRFDGVSIEYAGRWGRAGFMAVEDVSLSVGDGEVVGLVGESGSGKSTLARCAVGLLSPSRGRVEVCGNDITGLNQRELRPLRHEFGMVFQDPASSLNPRMTIGESIARPLVLRRSISRRQLRERVADLLEQVELPASWEARYPHELSGGQRQRVGLARALALQPRLLVADEPTSALDVSVQAVVLNLLLNLQREHGFSCLFITHDLAVVEILADRIAVLQRGRLVELGETSSVLRHPAEEYTRQLVASAPVPDPRAQRKRRELLRS